MKSARGSSSSFQGASANGVDLSLTGLPMQVLQRPSSATPGKHIARSISVITENKPKRNILEDAGSGSSRAMNNLRRSNSTTQVNQQVNGTFGAEHHGDFLTLFDSSSGGRKKLASLSKVSPEKKTTWNILDEQPRTFPAPSGPREAPVGMRKKEIYVPLAANFTANNRSNKGAMGNCVTTMVHNNYSTADKGPAPKSSNQATTSLNNIIKATSNEDTESSSYLKSQKNLSSSNILARNNNTSNSSKLLKRQEVSEEEAERFINQVNLAAVTIQRWYRRHSQRHKEGVVQLGHLIASKREERQQQLTEESNIFDLQRRRDEERRKIREEKARLARKAAIQELQQKRAQKALDSQCLVQEELAVMTKCKKTGRRKPESGGSVKNISPANSIVKANNAEANFHLAAADTEENSVMACLSIPGQNKLPEEQPQDVCSGKVASEDLETMITTASRAQSKVTLNELLDTLKLLEEEPEFLPPPKACKEDKYAWIDGEANSNSLTADNLEKFGKLNCSLGVPEEGTLLSEAKLQSIISFLDEMEKSEQERPRSAASASHREGLLSEEELAHLEQASAVATEVTSSIMRLKLEVEEKKRAITLLQTALAQQRELTVRHVKETEKELSRQLALQREQYEAAIQRHLAFIDQLIDDKKTLSEKCEAVVAELKQVDQKYTKKIAQMQEQHELVWRTLGPLCEEIKKLKELMSATEKIRREKWIDEKTKKIKEITVKGLEPEIQKLIAKHKLEIKKLKALHEAELLQSDERAAQRYVRQAEELREMLEHEKEEQGQRERELARQRKGNHWPCCSLLNSEPSQGYNSHGRTMSERVPLHRYEKQLEQEEQALQQQRRRLYSEVAEEKERLSQQAARQRAELEDLRRQLEENSSVVTKALKEEYEKGKEEQERRHQAEVQSLKVQLEIEKQAWEANYLKKEEAWLLARERELREEVRKERDKEIELVIQRLEADMSSSKEECERVTENRIKRVRDKYEAELQELERSERRLQERCNELKGRLSETEGETLGLQSLLRQKEQETEDIRKVRDQLAQERSSLSEVIRQEFADRLVSTEEENKRLKSEMAELRARQRLELDRVTRDKEEELEEVHKRVKTAIVKKEEAVNTLRKQYEAAVKRADHLEALLDQQRKQLLAAK
ncbi:centrosomal protein of 131 kDa isoform X2 [Sceloporus undulatus]|uniref:centrosomal protein of 131 kDa isoform X2 n=1 Tax=Sceloporus undulatus TaxID=8520 RepID=UPI001C4A8C4D|nr:centrosomal protein of 131 kDa isoform X2 [Sceloporus undulatus]